ncbi:membrane-associated sensor domain-containing protein [Buttiauxella gaviniae]|uniref:GGDEF domain-containing protein n=1 Tax=Buttiauxella gaviniae TaxID=82990 RepID=UPI003976FC66
MRQRAITVSGPWFLWINLLFCLFILGRHYFAPSQQIASVTASVPILEILMGLILAVSSSAIFILRMAHDQHAEWLSKFLYGALLCISALWVACFYVFLASGDSRIVFPFAALLIFTALISLYFDGRVLLSFTLPIWISILVCNFIYPSDLTVLNALLYLLLAGLFESGRRILRGWFVLAISREQENRELIKRLQDLANNDPLTGIANRRSFHLLLEKAMQRQQQCGTPLSLVMLDVDYFKKYNDHYGHQAGDECLVKIAQCLVDATRSTHDAVARFGGEEFIILLPDAVEQQAIEVAERIRRNLQALSIPHAASPVIPYVTISLGIATLIPGTTSTRLIAQADAALYKAKENGRNRWQTYQH